MDGTGHVSAATAVAKSDITALGIPESDTTYSAATTSAEGLMSAADKTKLDGVTAGANKYTHPSYTARASGLYKVTVDSTGHVSAAAAVDKSDITALGVPAQDTTYTHPSYTARASGLYKVTVDSTGHVSAVAAVDKSDITALGVPAQDTTYTHPSYTARGQRAVQGDGGQHRPCERGDGCDQERHYGAGDTDWRRSRNNLFKHCNRHNYTERHRKGQVLLLYSRKTGIFKYNI